MAKAAKGRKRPTPADALATLCFYFLRAEVMALQWRALERDLRSSGRVEELMSDVRTGYPPKQWAYWGFHMAALSTVVEGWIDLGVADSKINGILYGGSHDEHREQLKEFRHGIFHFSALNNPATLSAAANREFLRWVLRLHFAFRAYFQKTFREYPSISALQPNERDRSEGGWVERIRSALGRAMRRMRVSL